MALLTISPLQPTAAAQVKETRRVLILNELGPASPGINLIDGEIRARLERSPYQIELYNESLETTLFPDPAIQKEFFDSYIHKYRDRKPDVIIAVGPTPVHFLVQSHEKFFTDTPVVFCFTTPEMVGNPNLNSSFTGVWEMPDFAKTLEVALKLLPSTRHIVVVGGVLPYDRGNEAIIKDGLRRYETRFDITYLTDLDMPTLLERLTRLPKNSIILLAGISEDAAGNRYIIATQSNPMVVQAANAPIFPAGDMADVDVGQGAIGGYLTSFTKEGEIAAEDAERILNGDKAKDIPIVRGASAYIFDLRALKRWGLKEADVPPGSTVLNRQPSLWESFRWYVIGGMTLILVEALLISGLLWQRTRRKAAEIKLMIANEQLEADIADRKRAEETLRESEERLRMAVQAGKMFANEWDAATNKIAHSEGVKQILGEDEGMYTTGQQIMSMIPPEDQERLHSAVAELSPEKPILKITYRMVRTDGTVIWVDRNSRAYFDEHGKMLRIVGMLADITDRVRAEEALRGSQGQLLLVYSNVADCIFHVAVESDDRYRFLSVNPAFLKSTGLAEDQVVGKLVQEVIPVPSLTMVLRKYEEAIGGKKTVRWEETSEYPAGRKVGEVAVAPVFDEAGRCTHLVGAVHDITERKRSQNQLLFINKAIESTKDAIWISDAQGHHFYQNKALSDLFGFATAEEFEAAGGVPAVAKDPGIARMMFEKIMSGNSWEGELEIVTKSGHTFPAYERADVIKNSTGEVIGFIGIITDLTERKLAEETLKGMSGKLLEAQEQERARIGRELHDDINQRLALLSVEIQRIKEVAPVTYGELRSQMDELGKRTSEISAVVQSLSHELHSSKLEYLGLVSAMKSFCKEFGGKHKVEIDFNSEGIPSDVSPEVSLCLFRVMQEGLHNALKHSGVKLFDVKLRGSPTEIRLSVRDLGKGFDTELAKDTPGLGLVSMQERVRLVKGTISITSRPQAGTEINVRVPLEAEAQTERA